MNDKKFFFNHCFDKDRLKTLISWCFLNFGENKTLELLEKLKNFGFYFATQAGISLSIDDLTIPLNKSNLIAQADFEIENSKYHWKAGNLTAVEEFQQIIDTWHRTSETLRQDVVRNFRTQETLNPLSMMAFSGARGNISQVRQLVGMRGLMSDPQGQIIDFPIRSNFREGLTLIEYVISCYGARKGVVDTALRTANSGYLTRRLVDVAHHVVVGQFDCGTRRGSFLFKTSNFKERLVGRVIAEKIQFLNGEIVYRNQEINSSLAEKLTLLRKKVLVRSPLTCDAKQFVCQLCYGWSLAHGKLVSLGEAVGILAAQSIGEPGTQLTMRTFHTGGVFSGDVMNEIRAPFSGFIFFPEALQGKLIRTPHGKIAFLTKVQGIFVLTSNIQIKTKYGSLSAGVKNSDSPGIQFFEKGMKYFNEGNRFEKFSIPSGTLVFVRQNQRVVENELLVEYSSILAKSKQRVQSQHKLNAPQEGEIFFENVFLGIAKTNESVTFARKLSCFWILSGKLCSAPQFTTIFPKNGDFVEQNTLWSQWFLISPFNGFLQLNKTVESLRIPSSKHSTPKLGVKPIISIDEKKGLEKNAFFSKPETSFLAFDASQKENPEITKTNTVFLSQSLLYFSLFSIQYKKLGYFIYYPASPIIEIDKKYKIPLAHEKLFFAFSLESQKQNLHISNNFFYFRWFSPSLKIKAGRLLGLQNTFFDFNEYQGMILWVPEKRVFHTRRDFIFNSVFKNQQLILFRINHQGFFEKEFFQKKNRVKIQTRFLEKNFLKNHKKTYVSHSIIEPSLMKLRFRPEAQAKSPYFMNFIPSQKDSNSIPVKFLKKDQFFTINKKTKKEIFKQEFFSSIPTGISLPQLKIDKDLLSNLVDYQQLKLPKEKNKVFFKPIIKLTKTKNRFNSNLNFSRNFLKNPLSSVEKQIFYMPSKNKISFCANEIDTKKRNFFTKFTLKKYSYLLNFGEGDKAQDSILGIRLKKNFIPLTEFGSSQFLSNENQPQKSTNSAKTDEWNVSNSLFFVNEIDAEIKVSFFFVKKYFFSFKKRTLRSITEKLYSELPTFQISYQISKIFDLSLIYELHIREKVLQLQKVHKFQIELQRNLRSFFKKGFFAFFFEEIHSSKGILNGLRQNEFYQPIISSKENKKPFLLVNQLKLTKTKAKTQKQQLSKVRNLFITKKFQKASKVISTSGWIYFPKTTFQISKINNSIIHKGKLLVDDIRFDQYSIYNQNGYLNSINLSLKQVEKTQNFIPGISLKKNFSTEVRGVENPPKSIIKIDDKKKQNIERLGEGARIKNLKNSGMKYFWDKNWTLGVNFCVNTSVNEIDDQEKKASTYLSKKILDKLLFFPVKNTTLNNFHLTRQWYSTTILVEKNFFGQFFFKNTPLKQDKKDFARPLNFRSLDTMSGKIDQSNPETKFLERSQFLNFNNKKELSLIQYIFNKKTCWKFADPFFLSKNKIFYSTFYLRSLNLDRTTSFQEKVLIFHSKKTRDKIFKTRKNEIFFNKTKFKKVFKFSLKKNKLESLSKQKKIFYSANFLISKKHDYFAQIQLEFFKIHFSSSVLETLLQDSIREISLIKPRFKPEAQAKSPSFRQKNLLVALEQLQPKNFITKKPEFLKVRGAVEKPSKPIIKIDDKQSKLLFAKLSNQQFNVKINIKTNIKNLEKRNILVFSTIFRKVDESIFPDIAKSKKKFYHQYSKNSLKKKDFKNYLSAFTVNSPYFNKQNKTIFWNKVIKKNFFNLDFQVESYLNSHLFNKGLKQQTYCMSFIVAPLIEKNYPFQNALFRISKKNFFNSGVGVAKACLFHEATNQKKHSFFESNEEKNKVFFKMGYNISPKRKPKKQIFNHFTFAKNKFKVANLSFLANEIGSDEISQFLKKITFSSILEYLVQKEMQLSNVSEFSGVHHDQSRNFLNSNKSSTTRDIKFFLYQFDLIIAHTPFLVESFLSPYGGEILIKNPSKKTPLSNADSPGFSESLESEKSSFIPNMRETSFQTKDRETSFQALKKSEDFVLDPGPVGQKSLILTNSNQITFSLIQETSEKNFIPVAKNLFVGEMLRLGEEIADNYSISNSGQIFEIEKEKIVIRQAQPFLASSKSIFHVSHGEFIETSAPLLTLFYQRLKTGDIVQGIPKIEELFEARQTKQGEILENNIHQQLKKLFYVSKVSLGTKEAVRQSFEKIRAILVQEIQQVYQSQGVNISEKHIEIIVRQMTSKVRILDGGKTGLLPDEFVDLRWLEIINDGIKIKKAEYEPIVLGITKAALEAGSFISAASFQETTRVLTRAAIARKTDFLRGLKENVILGRLIPSGTGFSLTFQPQKSNFVIKKITIKN